MRNILIALTISFFIIITPQLALSAEGSSGEEDDSSEAAGEDVADSGAAGEEAADSGEAAGSEAAGSAVGRIRL